jgi:hypothetical protein
MKLRVNRFRTRRDAPSHVAGDAGAADTDAAGADASETWQDGALAANTDIDAIRREAFSGQQLRMAQRLARKHGLSPGSDLDAVRLLRVRGIDPFVQNPIRAPVARGDDAGVRGAVALPRTEPATGDAPQATEGDRSLASQTAAIRMAQADLATADLLLQPALETMRVSKIEANKQARYLTAGARPVAHEQASYPRVFENTVLAFLVFSGIYLLVSLTASTLREQVSS